MRAGLACGEVLTWPGTDLASLLAGGAMAAGCALAPSGSVVDRRPISTNCLMASALDGMMGCLRRQSSRRRSHSSVARIWKTLSATRAIVSYMLGLDTVSTLQVITQLRPDGTLPSTRPA
jgi:hypothetical protein